MRTWGAVVRLREGRAFPQVAERYRVSDRIWAPRDRLRPVRG